MEKKGMTKGMMSLEYAAKEERRFEAMAEEIGYERKTTFFSDLSIAEWHGSAAIRETYERVVKEWLSDVKYFTEFVMSLNWKMWEWSERGDIDYTEVYTELYCKAKDLALDTFKGDDLTYYIETTD